MLEDKIKSDYYGDIITKTPKDLSSLLTQVTKKESTLPKKNYKECWEKKSSKTLLSWSLPTNKVQSILIIIKDMGVMTVPDITEKLGLHTLRNREWYI